MLIEILNALIREERRGSVRTSGSMGGPVGKRSGVWVMSFHRRFPTPSKGGRELLRREAKVFIGGCAVGGRSCRTPGGSFLGLVFQDQSIHPNVELGSLLLKFKLIFLFLSPWKWTAMGCLSSHRALFYIHEGSN